MAPLDGVRAVLAVGVAVYAFVTYRKFRGGKMAEPYLIFTVSGIVGTCSAIADFLNLEVAHGLLGIVFYLLLLLGFMFIYRIWANMGK